MSPARSPPEECPPRSPRRNVPPGPPGGMSALPETDAAPRNEHRASRSAFWHALLRARGGRGEPRGHPYHVCRHHHHHGRVPHAAVHHPDPQEVRRHHPAQHGAQHRLRPPLLRTRAHDRRPGEGIFLGKEPGAGHAPGE
eukprot:572153-Prorocentrum_minimum.AAC.5